MLECTGDSIPWAGLYLVENCCYSYQREYCIFDNQSCSGKTIEGNIQGKLIEYCIVPAIYLCK
jgi:hypothetical protein